MPPPRRVVALFLALLVALNLSKAYSTAEGLREEENGELARGVAQRGSSPADENDVDVTSTIMVDGIAVAAPAPPGPSSLTKVGSSTPSGSVEYSKAAVAELSKQNVEVVAAEGLFRRAASSKNKAAAKMTLRLYQQAESFRQKAFEKDSPHFGAAAILLYKRAAEVGAGRGSADAYAALARMFEFGWDGVSLVSSGAIGQQAYSGYGFTSVQSAMASHPDTMPATAGRDSNDPLTAASSLLKTHPQLRTSSLRKAADDSESSSTTSSVLLIAPQMQAAISFYLASAALGNASAHFTASLLHSHGLYGVEQNEVRALLHLYFAALGGDKAAQFSLGLRHSTGTRGVPQSCSASVLYLQESAAAAAAAVEESHGLLQVSPQATHERLNDEIAGELWGSSSSRLKYLLHQGGLGSAGRLGGVWDWIKGGAFGASEADVNLSDSEVTPSATLSPTSNGTASQAAAGPTVVDLEAMQRILEGEMMSLGITPAVAKDAILMRQSESQARAAASRGTAGTDSAAASSSKQEEKRAAEEKLFGLSPSHENPTPGRTGRSSSTAASARKRAGETSTGYGLNSRRYGRRKSNLKGVPEPPVLPFYLAAADRGDLNAHANLGHLYLLGPKGIQRDFAKASEHFHAAAEGSDPMSMTALGFIYLHGLGVDKPDYYLAREFLQEPALQGNIPAAQNDLAVLYLKGLGGVERNPQTAFGLFQKAAKSNYPEASYNLGLMQLQGLAPANAPPTTETTVIKTTITTTVTQSADISASGVVKIGGSANGGAFVAQENLGLQAEQDAEAEAILSRSIAATERQRLLVRDYRGALQSFQAAAQQGHVPSLYRLGLMHLYGIGTANQPDCVAAQRAFKNAVYRVTGSVFPFLENAKAAFADGNAEAAFLSYLRASEIGLDIGTWNAAFLVHRGYVDEDKAFALGSTALLASPNATASTDAGDTAAAAAKEVSLAVDGAEVIAQPSTVSLLASGLDTLSPFRFLISPASTSAHAVLRYLRSLAIRALPTKLTRWLSEIAGPSLFDLPHAGNATSASSSLLTESSGFSAPRSLKAQAFVASLLLQSASASQNAHAELLLGDYVYWGLGGLVPQAVETASSDGISNNTEPRRSAASVIAARDRYLAACNGHVPQACYNLGMLCERGYPPTQQAASTSSSRRKAGAAASTAAGGGKIIGTGSDAQARAANLPTKRHPGAPPASISSVTALPVRRPLDENGLAISSFSHSGYLPVRKGDGSIATDGADTSSSEAIIIERDQHLAKRYYDLCLEKQFQAIALGSTSATGASTVAAGAVAAGNPNVAVVTAGRYSGSVLAMPVKFALWRMQVGNAWGVFRDDHLRPILDLVGRKLMAVTPLRALDWLLPARFTSRIITSKPIAAVPTSDGPSPASTSGGKAPQVIPGEALPELVKWLWGDFLEALNEGANDPLAPQPTRPGATQQASQKRAQQQPDAEAHDETSESYRRLKHARNVRREEEISKLVTPLRYWAERAMERFLGEVTSTEWLDEVHTEAAQFHHSIKSLEEGPEEDERDAAAAAAPAVPAPGTTAGGTNAKAPDAASNTAGMSLAERQSRRQQALLEAKRRRAARAYEENVIKQFLQRCLDGVMRLWDELWALWQGDEAISTTSSASSVPSTAGVADQGAQEVPIDRVPSSDEDDEDGELSFKDKALAFGRRAAEIAEDVFDASLAPVLDLLSATVTLDDDDDGNNRYRTDAELKQRRRARQEAAVNGENKDGALSWPRWQKVLAVVFAVLAPLFVWDTVLRQRRRLVAAEQAREAAAAALQNDRPAWNR
jgi:uncharacterized protein